MRKSTFVTLFAVMFIAVTALTAAAQSAPGGPPGPPAAKEVMANPGGPAGEFGRGAHFRPSLEALQKKLGLTDEQKKQARGLYTGFSDRTRKARTELLSLKDEKRTMLMSGKVDQQKLAQLDDQIVKLKSDVMRERLKMKRDRLAILTPDQIEKLADLKAHKAFRHKLGGMHRGERKGHFGD
ncbi:MAG: periplasmic heavy metal sensor [Desulfomonile tiedjei]|nr:periplasmic heavy metal sensor [Desulfomonile tiedjei]